jgi:murein tripeptide amidase MpaA
VEETNTSANHRHEIIRPGDIADIGNSWDKVTAGGAAGYDIYALELTNQSFEVPGGKPTFFLMAEIHAREYTTAETATRFAEYLVNNYGTNPDITWLLDYFRIFIVTMTNPDGRKFAETGELWRKIRIMTTDVLSFRTMGPI